MRKFYFKLFILLLISNQAISAYYDTVPAGRRALVFKRVMLTDVDANINSEGNSSPLSFNKTIDLPTLADLEPKIAGFLNTIRQDPNPEISSIPDKLVLSGFAADLKADIDVQAYGLAFGITDKFMVYGALPVYTASIKTNLRRTLQSNYNEILKGKNLPIPDSPQTKVALQQIQDLDGSFLQGVAVNTLNYKPMGDWEAKDIGDIEVGVLYRLTDWDRAGIAISGGFVAPTGKQDNPDILQDIPFGDGQWDVFAELGGGVQFFDGRLSIDSYIRYTAQLPTTKDIRAPLISSFTALGDHYITVYEDLGDTIDLRLMGSFSFNDLFSMSAGYEAKIGFSKSYESLNATTDELQMLEENTDTQNHYAKFGASISTIPAFLAKKFLLPMKIDFTAQFQMYAKNTIDANRFEATLTFFF